MKNLFPCVAVAVVGVVGCVSVGERPAGETCRAEATVEGAAPSLLPEGRSFRLVWNDEFAGDAFEVDTVRVYDIVRSGK